MTYAAYENSRESATPIELYEFVQGTKRWNYISGADLIVFASQPYTPLPVQRDRIKQNPDTFKNGMKISFPRDDSFASQFLGFAPEEKTILTIRRGHLNDPDQQFVIQWKGKVQGAVTSGNEIDISCESIFTSMKKPGLRAKFEYSCRRTLYLSGCNVNRELFKVEGPILSISSLQVSVGAAGTKPDGYFTGGILLAPDGSSRFITAHTGDTVTLTRPLYSLDGGQVVSLYPGCDHLRTTCNTKFNNLDNFGGFPFIPQRNPFDGSSLY